VWDNVGFDGPVLPRDLSFDVPDGGTPSNTAPGAVNLGWPVGPDYAPVTLTTQPVTAANIAAASQAIVTLDVTPSGTPTEVDYSLNGGATLNAGWPGALPGFSAWPSLALPVPLADLAAGANAITISIAGADSVIGNVDLKLVGAGGIVPP